MIIDREYYVIQNKHGEFFSFDTTSGGYPVFMNNYKLCKRFDTENEIITFLNSKYVTEQFKNEFIDIEIKKIKVKKTMEDVTDIIFDALIPTKTEVIDTLKKCFFNGDSEDNDNKCLDCPYRKYAYNMSDYKGTNCDTELIKDVIKYLEETTEN